ncbi:hypothetical protein J3459_015956 [Metarhizium acridum]|nr:hypothetical protein J3459_015956 [Metarhizium acridum]
MTRGHRVEIGEIESYLEPALTDDVSRRNVQIIAEMIKGLLDGIQDRLDSAEMVPPYVIPSAFLPIGKLPTTPTGRVDRQQLCESPVKEEVAAREEDPENLEQGSKPSCQEY